MPLRALDAELVQIIAAASEPIPRHLRPAFLERIDGMLPNGAMTPAAVTAVVAQIQREFRVAPVPAADPPQSPQAPRSPLARRAR
jgi:hypothetical protein